MIETSGVWVTWCCLAQNNSYSPYFGAIVGRVTSRIANASFTLDGTKWRLLANENGNTQHGGPVGWSAKNWTLTRADSPRGEAALFSLTSPPGDQVCVRVRAHA